VKRCGKVYELKPQTARPHCNSYCHLAATVKAVLAQVVSLRQIICDRITDELNGVLVF